MMNLQLSSTKTRIFLSIIGLGLTALILNGCSPQAPEVPENSTTGKTQPTPPPASPAVEGVSTSQTEPSEKAQLDALSKDAATVEQGLNDQPITVN